MQMQKQESRDPIQGFRFLVEAGDSDQIYAAFSQFSGVQMELEAIRFRAGDDRRGVQEYIPVMTSYAPVTFSKGVIGDNDFLDWVFSASADLFQGFRKQDKKKKEEDGENEDGGLRRTIYVSAIDERKETRIIWTLKDALPIGYQLAPMDGTRSEVLMETLTFAITGVARNAF